MPIVTRLNYLKAAVIHCASRDVRFYLTGVYLGDGYLAATDGHKLIIIDDDILGLGLIIPRDAIISLGKKVKSDFDVEIEIKDNGFGLMSCAGQYEYFKFIEGKFSVVSKADIPEPEQPIATFMYFNSDYLRDFSKSMQILTGNKAAHPIVKSTGTNSSAYIKLTDYAHGVLMPMRQ